MIKSKPLRLLGIIKCSDLHPLLYFVLSCTYQWDGPLLFRKTDRKNWRRLRETTHQVDKNQEPKFPKKLYGGFLEIFLNILSFKRLSLTTQTIASSYGRVPIRDERVTSFAHDVDSFMVRLMEFMQPRR